MFVTLPPSLETGICFPKVKHFGVYILRRNVRVDWAIVLLFCTQNVRDPLL